MSGRKWTVTGTFVVVLLALLAPIVFAATRSHDDLRLGGAYEEERDTSLTVKGWFDGTYQEHKEHYLKRHFSLNPIYIRGFFQLEFHLFKKARAQSVLVGIENYLYERSYIDAYYGRNLRSYDSLVEMVLKVRALEDTLRRLNKLALVVLAPGKASYFPEYIPEALKGPPARSNYLVLSAALKHYHVPHIDFNHWFIKQKHKSRYPLYSQYGIHWSNYGSMVAFDSITKYIENYLDVNLPDLKLGPYTVTNDLRPSDDDMISGLNLLVNPPTYSMAYPEYSVEYDSTRHKKLSMITIADSYWWYIFSTNIPMASFTNHRFWYYNAAIYSSTINGSLTVGEFDYAEEIRTADVILILNTEPNYGNLGNRAIDVMYAHFFGNRKVPGSLIGRRVNE